MRVLADEFGRRVGWNPDQTVVVDATGRHPVSEVWTAATKLTEALVSRLDGAPTVVVQADNTWRTMAAMLAIGRCDGLIVVLSRHATAGEVALAIDDLQPDAVVAAPETVRHWGLDDGDFPGSAEIWDGWSVRSGTGATRGVERWNGGAVVAMTSGSTGRPKCVVQSEGALRYAGRCTIDAVRLRRGDPVGALVPLSSVAAFCFGLYLPAMLEGVQVCLDTWKPEDAVELLRREEVRWTMLVPTMALQLATVPSSEGALSAMTAMTVGGGPMTVGALQRAEHTLDTRMLRVFGMSECLGHTTPSPQDDAETRLSRDGRPFPGTDVRVVDNDGQVLSSGQVGRLQVRGPSLFVGYAQQGSPHPPELTQDGFLPTGDRARLNDDGTLNILGREKEVIIRGGRNIDINEVESAMADLDEVDQVCVVPVPDEVLGERAAALVVTPGALSLEDVQAKLEHAGVAKFKWPEFVHTVSSLPQNRVGKLSRTDAAEMAARLNDRAPA